MSLRKYSVRFALLGLVMAGTALAAPSAFARGHVSFGVNIGVPAFGYSYPAYPANYAPAYYGPDYYPAYYPSYYPAYGSVYYYGGYGHRYYGHGYYRHGGYYNHGGSRYYGHDGYYHRGH